MKYVKVTPIEAKQYDVTDINGEHWAIKEDVFKKTYRPIKDGDEK